MPITITLPQPANAVGPGFAIHWSSDFVGPLTTDTYWRLQLAVDSEGTRNFLDTNILANGILNRTHVVFTDPEPSALTTIDAPANGQPVYVHINLVQSTSSIDSGSLTTTWDGTSALGSQAQRFANRATSGFTSTDRATIQSILDDVQLQVGVPFVGLSRMLSWLLPPTFGNRHGSFLISGQGAIARFSEPFRGDAIGFEWHWFSVPAGYGLKLGSINEYELRMVQFRTIARDSSGQLFQDEFLDSVAEGERHMFRANNVETLEWYVSPGVIAELSFLVPLLG